MIDDNDINSLKSELTQLKAHFTNRIEHLENKLSKLTNAKQPAADNQQIIQSNIASDSASSFTLEAPAIVIKTPPETQIVTPKSAHPHFLSIVFSALMSSTFDWFEPVTNIYRSYKERNMLGIFILTILGIGLILSGFGYLMQLLIDELGAGSKSLLMVAVASSVIVLGIVMKKKTSFGEFSTAIVSLGLLLLYSTVYFAGSVYHVIPYILVVTLYLLIALSSHIIALWLETKIVAALGIVGISLMPILSDIIVVQPNYYLLSLAFVTISSLIISYRFVGPWLANLSLIFVMMSLEWVTNIGSATLSPFFIDLFYLLFFTYIALVIIKLKDTDKKSLLFVVALFSTNLLLFVQSVTLFSHSISLIFTINALIATAATYFFYKAKHPLTYLMVLVASIWGVFAIVSSISQAYWGIAWAVEGLFLLYLGRRYALPIVINEGQLLTGIALFYGINALLPYFPVPALMTIDGWTFSLSLSLIMGIWLRLINDSELFNQLTIQKIKPLLMLAESIWLTILLISYANLLIGPWTAPLIVLIQFSLLLRAKQCKQISIEIFSALLIFIPLIYAMIAVLIIESFHFSALPLAAKLALISVFLQLWLFAEYYRRYQPDSAMVKIAEWARIGFYLLIPVCWLGSAIRNLDVYLLMILWVPPVIALFFAIKTKHNWIIWQAKILISLSSVLLILGVLFFPIVVSAATLGLFISCYVIAYFLNKHSKNKLYQFACSLGLLTIGLTLPLCIASVDRNIELAIIVAALYWGTLFNLSSVWSQKTYVTISVYLASFVITLGSLALISNNLYFTLVPVIYIAAALYKKEQRFKLSRIGSLLGKNAELSLHTLGAITYICLLIALDDYRLDLLIAPALAVHGALILFLKDRRLTTVKFSFSLLLLAIVKLSLIDAANALLWQKVMLFMGIGVFILVASFWYQKLDKQE